MKYFYDTEFLENGKTIKLISIGIVAEDGREYYAVNSDMPLHRIKRHPWLSMNVLPQLPLSAADRSTVEKFVASSPNIYPRTSLTNVGLDMASTVVKPKFVIANEVRDFLLADIDNSKPELWAYYGAYDHVLLAQLFGTMVNLPKGIPMVTHDIMTYSKITGVDMLPKQPDGLHQALVDARHVKTMYDHICREVAAR